MCQGLSFRTYLLSILCITLFATRVFGQATTNAVCVSGSYDWMRNSLFEYPCEVASKLSAVCNNGGYHVEKLPVETNNTYPPLTAQTQNPCVCSLVVYNLFQACSQCQNGATERYSRWTAACAQKDAGYPRTIPAGTAVPGWAYTDSRAGDDFDLNAAQSSVGVPESTAGTSPTGVSTAGNTGVSTAINGATTNAPAVSNAQSAATHSTASSDPSSTVASSDSPKPSQAPAIGGAIGGVLSFSIGVLVFFLWRRYYRKQSKAKRVFPTGIDDDVELNQPPSTMGKKSGEVDEEQPPQPIPYVLRQDLLPPPGQEEPATMELSEKRRMLLSREQERIGQNRLPEVGSFPQGPRSEDGNSEEEGAGPSSGGATGSRTKGASSSATATSPVSPSLSGTTSALDQPLSEHDLSRLASKVVSMMASTGSAADSESPPSYQPR